MKDVVIVDGVRTAIGRMGGTLKEVPVDFLAAKVIKAVLTRTNLEGEAVDEVIFGHAKQSSDNPNLARLALLRAGLPVAVPGYTVHRQCGSGLQAVLNAAQQIQCDLADFVVAGGAESMSTAPYYIRGVRYGLVAGNGEIVDPNTESQPRAQPIEAYGHLTMGLTAENLAEQYNISREEQDVYALESQRRAARAIEAGHFKGEIVPFEVKRRKQTVIFDTDEHPRQTSLEKLAKLPAVFKEGGTVTAGNASGRNDAASALVIASREAAEMRGLKPKVRILAQAVAGVRPDVMGIGPVPATKKALKIAGLKLEDIDLIELNEAFAAQTLAVMREMGLDHNRVNVNGGAIALGHPIGATGAILMTKLIHALERRKVRYGLVSLCIGGGQGISCIVENLNT
ncbi:thiolase family protein [Novibacillus thermophilus]|jgi:acetyl-CoA C-acetyltransferase|uniref:acetyl-CoA C-acetyltransferase n=1 Tax=Novibacillus thermophilus TaxID=1471761 RepID=A0A1U9K8J3_9BACL|nr:thiolase family protein [Novibacillus thermophilus]AQS56326.1 acetyl-CoA acetyltransferase [Novibacillus thermophilus]